METLSEKIEQILEGDDWRDIKGDYIEIDDVKQFIKDLKEEFSSMEPIYKMIFNNGINKLAGEKLI